MKLSHATRHESLLCGCDGRRTKFILRRLAMKKPKPLAKIGKVEIHRSKFHAFETVKYLDIAALKKASKARIEIGRVEGGGTEATIVAEVSKGMITKLTPIACEGCAKPASAAARK